MKKIIVFLIFLIIISLFCSSCKFKDGRIKIENIKDYGECYLQCKKNMDYYFCQSATIMYDNICECLLLDCIKEIPIGKINLK